jgi:ribosomal protein RSM22 (predicted rRNA methylase)
MKPTIQLPPYPEELTQWWWNQAVQKWPDHGEEKVLNLLREEIVRQSNRFNKSRDFDPSAYGARDLSLLAYGNFYTPRTFAACGYSLAEAFDCRGWRAPGKGPIHILDLGCGSGASSLAALYYLRSWGIQNPILLDAWDYSAKSLAFLRRIHREAQHLWPDTRISTDRMDIRHLSSSKPTKTKANYDLILSSYAFNECWEGENQTNCTEILSTLGSLLKEKGQLVWIEPAEGQVCRALHAASAQATKESERLFLQAPYFHGMPCPLLQNESKYFSHEVRPCSPSSEVERINRPLNLEIREVKFGFTILSKTQPRSFPNEPKVLRIISPVRKRKGTLSFWGIGTDGKETEYEWQRRNLDKGEQKSILELQRGDVIQISEVVNTEEKRVRIAQADQISPVFLPRWEKRS